MDTIYVESAVRKHPRAVATIERNPRATVIECDHYGEIFNLRSQNFRLQKKRPALILAEKRGRKVIPTPPDYSIGADRNFYFSHMLNCLYDCRYCFLQGMYRSAHYVHFLNYEDFETEIDEIRSEKGGKLCFFSGYDCDSLVFEKMTGFAERFIPFFAERPDSWLELRTKSLATSALERSEPVPNIVTAYTLTPDSIAREIEHGAPSFEHRLNRVRSLTQQGWIVGLRLDPLIPFPGFRKIYTEMIERVFREVDSDKIHSVTLGPMRFPKAMYDRIVKLYPDDPLFALGGSEMRDGQMSYPEEIEKAMVDHVYESLTSHLPAEKIFRQT